MLYVKSRMSVTVCLHLYAGTWVPSPSYELPSKLICQFQMLYDNFSIYAECFISYAMCYMTSAICRMLCAICQTPYARLQYAKCYDHCYIFSMTTEQVGHLIIYIYISIIRLWLSILPLQRRNPYYTTMASIYISGLRYFSLSTH
jgi:hypothetical protein